MSNIDEKAKNNFTIEMMYYTFFYEIRNGRRLIGKNRVKEISFYRMNARDVRSLASLCVVSWYALNVCVGRFLCSMLKAFLGNAFKIGS